MANYTYTQNGITFNDVKAPWAAQGGNSLRKRKRYSQRLAKQKE